MQNLPIWEVRVDAKGRTYYINHVLKKTQWDPPIGFDASSANDGGVVVSSLAPCLSRIIHRVALMFILDSNSVLPKPLSP